MIINDLDGYYIVFDTKNWNTELDTLVTNTSQPTLENLIEIARCLKCDMNDLVRLDDVVTIKTDK